MTLPQARSLRESVAAWQTRTMVNVSEKCCRRAALCYVYTHGRLRRSEE